MNLPLLAAFLVSTFPIGPGARFEVPLGEMEAGATYRVEVSLEGPIGARDRARVVFSGPGDRPVAKVLHAGDPDLYLPYRPRDGGPASIRVEVDPASPPLNVRATSARRQIADADRPAFRGRAERLLAAGQSPWSWAGTFYGSADDVDYLDNADEGRAGDRLVPVRGRGEHPDPGLLPARIARPRRPRPTSGSTASTRLRARPGLYEAGKDPTEIVHDRERERYSTHLSRTLPAGIYFVEVNANHPDYIFRTRTYSVPPLADPSQAVEAGLDYLLNAGDAWFAQVPREGNLFVRSGNLHDTATRCTACHASSFPTEAALVGQANGYPDPVQGVHAISDGPAGEFADAPLRRRRPVLAAIHRHPAPVAGEAGGDRARLRPPGRGAGLAPVRAVRAVPAGRLARGGGRSRPTRSTAWLPLDSKFGLAWRDWRVLTEMTARTGRVAYAQGADAIADLLDDPATDRMVETLQDRIHRLHAWWLIDKTHFAPRIRAEADALLALQNPDGGWHELDRKPGPSAVYTTGQLTWTLLKLGFRRDDPRIARALAYLLGQQQPFGGVVPDDHPRELPDPDA